MDVFGCARIQKYTPGKSGVFFRLVALSPVVVLSFFRKMKR